MSLTDELSSPVSESPLPASREVLEVPIALLQPDPFQPRKEFNEAAIRELAASIEQHGLLQPLLVRPRQGPNSRGKYWIVGGERRYRAAQLLGMKSLPCCVRPYENTAAAVVALAENVHREDLNEIEKAEALDRIRTLTHRTWDEVAELVKLSRDYVKRLVGLLKLEEEVKEKVRTGAISARCAIALKPLPATRQIELAERVVKEGLTAEQIRAEARKYGGQRSRHGGPAPALFAPDALEDPSRQSRSAVVRTLQDCAQAVAQIEQWLDAREWPPSRVPEAQRKALEELHSRVALLHQHLMGIRAPLREPELTDAERLRRAERTL